MRRFLSGGGISAFIFIILFVCGLSSAEVYYVPSRGLPTIQSGIDAAASGDTVVVAPGTYSGDGNVDLDFGGKAITLRSEIDPCNPNWDVIESTVIDCQGNAYNPHRAFHFDDPNESGVEVYGFKIINGYARGPKGADGTVPPGIYEVDDSQYTNPLDLIDINDINDVNNIDIDYNDANYIDLDNLYTEEPNAPVANPGEDAEGDGYGGAILCENNASPTIRFCIIEDCMVTGAQGGAGAPGLTGAWAFQYMEFQSVTSEDDIDQTTGLYDDIEELQERYQDEEFLALEEGTGPALVGYEVLTVEVEAGQDGGQGGDGSGIGYGGAVACLGSSPVIKDCKLINNSARGGVGGAGGDGGDGADTDGDGQPDEQESAGGNAGASYGGGLGGAVYADSNSTPVIESCLISENDARTGTRAQGGAKGEGSVDDEDPKFPGSGGFVDANDVGIAGGAIYHEVFSEINVTDTHFTGNEAYEISYNYGMYDYYRTNYYQVIEEEVLDYDYTRGGAVYADGNNPVHIVDSNIVSSRGGGIYLSDLCTADINNVSFEDNSETYSGGALFLDGSGFLDLRNSEFIQNSSTGDGGAIKLNSDANLVNCSFTTNVSTSGYGGAIDVYLAGTTLSVDVNDCSFVNNSADIAGGLSLYDFNDTALRNSYFIGNTSTKGGGISMEDGEGEINDCMITGNTATSGHGGGIYSRNVTVDMRHSVVYNNSAAGEYPAGGSGGGLYIKGTTATDQSLFNILLAGNSAEVDGGAVYLSNAVTDINNCTLVNNSAEQFGGGVFADFSSNPFITDTILSGNSNYAVYEEENGNATVEYSLFYDNPDGDYRNADGVIYSGTDVSSIPGGSNNNYADPVFAEGLMGSYYLDQQQSPAVDYGSDTAANLGLDTRTTDPNDSPDISVVDAGYHYKTAADVDTYQLTVNIIGEGSVTPMSGTYKEGSIVELTAQPEEGYRVESWRGTNEPNSTDQTSTVLMNSDKTVTVVFSQPRTHIVAVGGGQQGSYYSNILDALHESVDGDVIVVYPGIYRGISIEINKEVEIRSVHPDDPCYVENTIIDRAGYGERAFQFTESAVLNGLTIRNCNWGGATARSGDRNAGHPSGWDGGTTYGAAIYINEGIEPVIKNCIIRDNSLTGVHGGNGENATQTANAGRGGWGGGAYGGAVYCAPSSTAEFINTRFINNQATGGNGGNGGNQNLPGVGNYGGNYSRAEAPYPIPTSLQIIDVEGDLWEYWGFERDYSYYTGIGGAVYVDEGAEITFRDCQMTNNIAEGGMSGNGGAVDWEPEIAYEIPSFAGAVYCANDTTVEFVDCNIADNESSPMTDNYRINPYLGHGGGVCAEDSAAVIFKNCNIEGNRASAGGGFHFGRANPIITDSNFVNNLAYHGGGIFGERGDALIKDSNIAGNRAELSIYPAYPDANLAEDYGEVWGMGGGLHLWGTYADVNGSHIHDNFAESSGGGAYFGGEGAPQLFNSLVTDNTAGRDGGGVSANIYSQLDITNSTIVNNYVTGAYDTANFGGGLSVSYDSRVDVNNSIIWKNYARKGAAISVGTGFRFDTSPSKVNVTYSDVGPVYDPCKPFDFYIPEEFAVEDINYPEPNFSIIIGSEAIYDDLSSGDGKADVIVNLYPPEVREGIDWTDANQVSQLREEISTLQDKVIGPLPQDEVSLRYRFDNIAAFSAEVTETGLNRLKRSSLVQNIEPVRTIEPMLAQGIDLIDAGAYRREFDGRGMAIAICDTGIDYNHPMLGDGGFPNDKVIGGYDFGEEDSDPMAVGNSHGTACAGIAAGAVPPNDVNDYIGGVAPNAKLYAIKMSPDNSDSATTDAMIASWDWCVSHYNDDPNNPIKIISTSFGSPAIGFNNPEFADWFSPGMTTAARTAVENDITVLAASGNEYRTNGIAWPAAISYVISVGAVDDIQDTVLNYSNTDEMLDILAPSEDAYTTDITGADGYTDGDYYPYFNGTSAACPYAAGAVAVIQSYVQQEYNTTMTPQEIRGLLKVSGDPVTDWRVDITKPRVNVGKAISYLPTDPIFVEENCTATGYDPNTGWDPNTGNISEDPNFIAGYFLSQIAAGQDFTSPAVDAGGSLSSALGLDTLTTRTDGYPDVNDPNYPDANSNIVDMGYHYDPCDFPLYKLTVEYDANELTVEPGTGYYRERVVNLEVVSSIPSGYEIKWTGTHDDEITAATNYVVMDANKTVSAELVRDSYELTIEIIGKGTVETDPNDPNSTLGGTFPRGDVVELTAKPAEGYRLGSWDGTDNDNIIRTTNTVTMSKDKTVTVEFEKGQTLSVPGEYTTVQAAIDNARDGDRVLLDTGVYVIEGGILIDGKSIEITSTQPDDQTVVENTVFERSPGSGSGINFRNVDSGAVLNGVTLRGFSFSSLDGDDGEDPGEDGVDGGSAYGGAIDLRYASPVIKNCIIEDSGVTGGNGGNGAAGDADNLMGGNGGYPGRAYGGGIYIGENSNPKIINCQFINCFAQGGNGGDGGQGHTDPDGTGGMGGGYYYGPDSPRYYELANRDPYYMYSGLGGAVYITEECSPEFIDCNFVSNATYGGVTGIGGQIGDTGQYLVPGARLEIENRGAAVFAAPNSTPYFEGCSFVDNEADTQYTEAEDPYVSYGGGVAFERSAAPIFEECQFTGNTASVGGGIYANDAILDIADSNFVTNAAYHGGGLYLTEIKGTLTACDVIDNNAVGEPFYPGLPVMDEILGYGGGVYLDTARGLKIKDTVFTDNTADVSGGGIYSTGGGGESELENCLIASNKANRSGAGAAVTWLSEMDISNCTFGFNLVTTTGFDNGFGGGLFSGYNGYANVIDSIFWANIADTGSQIAIGNDESAGTEGSLVEIDYSDIQGGRADIHIAAESAINYGDDNIFEYPYFVSGPVGDFYLSQLDTDDPNQTEQSPAVDAGSRMSSDAGMISYTTHTEYKPDKGVVDMGYHYPPETELAECRLCDAHADGFIDLKDYAILALNWFNSGCSEGNGWCDSSDFNFDMQVDYEDMRMLNECWLAEDTGAPIPDPSKWETTPYITEDGDANMVAKESIDEWGWDVEYYFECTTDPNRSSGWIAENSYLDTALEPSTQYEYRVRVRDEIGNITGWSTDEYVITSVDPGPDAADPPTWVIPPDAIGTDSITMQASGGDGTLQYTSYYFQRSDVETFDANTVTTGWQDPNSWTDTGLDPNTTYWYRVRAIDENGKVTDWSTVESETTLPEGQQFDDTPPAPVPTITAVEWQEGGYYYEAVEVTNADNIEDESPPIEFKFVCYNNDGYSSDWTTDTQYYVLVSTLGNKNFSWRVKARDAQGNETEFSELTQAVAGPRPEWVPVNP